MKAFKNRKIKIMVLVLVFGLIIGFVVNNNMNKRLEETQIATLREKYPICGLEVPATLSMTHLSLDQVKNYAETFVYGEIVGDFETYSTKLSTGNIVLDENRKENGLSDEYSYYEYTISVINDTEGIIKKGEKITISDNVIFMDYNPKLSDGMRVVVPIMWRDEDVPTRAYYTVDGMYYVTEEGYAISAFDENATYSKSKDELSGVKVDTLLKKLKK